MNWTEEELKKYSELATDYSPLIKTYKLQGIPARKPEEREWLAWDILKKSFVDESIFRQMQTKNGNAKALQFLEKKIEEIHKRKIARLKEEIPIPLE